MDDNRSLIDDIYKEIILEHSRHPHHFGELENADRTVDGYNPLCGDRITLSLKFDDEKNRIEDIKFTGNGCAICNASASMMTDCVDGKSVEQGLSAFQRFHELMMSPPTKDPNPEDLEPLGDADALLGVRRLPMRVKCATLAWHALKEALTSDKHGNTISTE